MAEIQFDSPATTVAYYSCAADPCRSGSALAAPRRIKSGLPDETVQTA